MNMFLSSLKAGELTSCLAAHKKKKGPTMDFNVLGMISVFFVVFSSLGISHAMLRNRMDRLEMEILKRVTDNELRVVINDKIAPITVEYKALNRRMDELHLTYKELDNKINRLIEICTNAAKA